MPHREGASLTPGSHETSHNNFNPSSIFMCPKDTYNMRRRNCKKGGKTQNPKQKKEIQNQNKINKNHMFQEQIRITRPSSS
jgi:hypothetical protein